MHGPLSYPGCVLGGAQYPFGSWGSPSLKSPLVKNRCSNSTYFITNVSQDHIHSSSQGCLINKAIKCLGSCVINEPEKNMVSEGLHTIAKLRFAITVASDAIRTVLAEGPSEFLLSKYKL